jgi:hypothetical protein
MNATYAVGLSRTLLIITKHEYTYHWPSNVQASEQLNYPTKEKLLRSRTLAVFITSTDEQRKTRRVAEMMVSVFIVTAG